MLNSSIFHRVDSSLRRGTPDAAVTVYDEFVTPLMGLARRRLQRFGQSKFDPDDIVQSVFRTLFRRYRDEKLRVNDWQHLWALLVSITLFKCHRQKAAFMCQKRDIRREQVSPGRDGEFGPISIDALPARQPTPEEILAFDETLDLILGGLSSDLGQIVALKLQLFTNEEISERVGRTERTVYRVLAQVRSRLEDLLP